MEKDFSRRPLVMLSFAGARCIAAPARAQVAGAATTVDATFTEPKKFAKG